MTPPTRNIEDLFLKIFKVVVLLIMSMALIAILVLSINVIYQSVQTPKEPAPAQKAPAKDPVKEINLDNLKQFLLDRERQENNKGNVPQQLDGRQTSLQFLEDATPLYRCSVEFGKKIGAGIEEPNNAINLRRLEELRWRMEKIANDPLHGDAWAKAAVSFTCSALADESLIALKKEGKVKTVFYPILEFHAEAWERIQKEKIQFEESEKNRVASERNAEERRIDGAKSSANKSLIAAASFLALFMFLALYLIASKIENNLRDINESIRANGQQKTDDISEINI